MGSKCLTSEIRYWGLCRLRKPTENRELNIRDPQPSLSIHPAIVSREDHTFEGSVFPVVLMGKRRGAERAVV